MPTDTATLPPAARAVLTARYREIRARCGVPPWVVRAYVLARHRGADVRAALAEAHFGAGPHGPGVAAAVAGWLQGIGR